MEYPLGQSSWSRAKQDTISAQKTARFMWGGEGVLAVGGGTWLAQIAPLEASTLEIVGRSVIGGLGGLLTAIFLIFSWNLFRAPYRQRDEVVKALKAMPGTTPNSPKVALAELHFPKVVYHIEIEHENQPQIHIEPLLISTGVMTLEAAKIEISGECIPCHDWRSRDLWPGGTYSLSTRCKLSHNLSKGSHTIRLLIYANKEWHASEWETISYEPSNPDKVGFQH